MSTEITLAQLCARSHCTSFIAIFFSFTPISFQFFISNTSVASDMLQICGDFVIVYLQFTLKSSCYGFKTLIINLIRLLCARSLMMVLVLERCSGPSLLLILFLISSIPHFSPMKALTLMALNLRCLMLWRWRVGLRWLQRRSIDKWIVHSSLSFIICFSFVFVCLF